MVSRLSKEEKDAIRQVVHAAKEKTRAELVAVITPASDIYRDVILFYGALLGMFLSFAAKVYGLRMDLPDVFLLQLGLACLLLLVPFLRHLCVRLVPKHQLHHRARQHAAMEYMHIVHHLPTSVPFVLIFVSVAERYVHIYSSRTVREKIPDSEWNAVVKTLTQAVKGAGIRHAVIQAVEHAGEMLRAHFPASSWDLHP